MIIPSDLCSFEALLRADMCHRVAPLPLLADCPGSTGSRTAEASRSRLLALGAGGHHGRVRMGRVSQSNRHDNCKQRCSKSLQHSFFLPKGRQRRNGLISSTGRQQRVFDLDHVYCDQARRIAMNIAKLPELLRKP